MQLEKFFSVTEQNDATWKEVHLKLILPQVFKILHMKNENSTQLNFFDMKNLEKPLFRLVPRNRDRPMIFSRWGDFKHFVHFFRPTLKWSSERSQNSIKILFGQNFLRRSQIFEKCLLKCLLKSLKNASFFLARAPSQNYTMLAPKVPLKNFM